MHGAATETRSSQTHASQSTSRSRSRSVSDTQQPCPAAPLFLTFSKLRTRLRTFLQMPVSISLSRGGRGGRSCVRTAPKTTVTGWERCCSTQLRYRTDCDRAAVAPPTHYLRIVHQQVQLLDNRRHPEMFYTGWGELNLRSGSVIHSVYLCAVM